VTCHGFGFPFNIPALNERLSQDSLYTVENINEKHTMAPLYKPFRPLLTAASVQDSRPQYKITRRKGRGCNIEGTSTFFREQHKKERRYLRACPQCIESDIKSVGESYWHRSHQVYGVDICYKHGEVLVETGINVSTALKQIQYELPGRKWIKFKTSKTTQSNELFFKIAKSVHWLLNCNSSMTSIEDVTAGYHSELRKNGYDTDKSSAFLWKLQQDLIGFYTDKSIDTSTIQNTRYGRLTWIENLLEGEWDLLHPLDHLLFIQFLGLSCQDFIVCQKAKFHPFGPGPWPCLNPAAPHFLQRVVESCDITPDDNAFRVNGTFSCSCGFQFSMSWPYRRNNDPSKPGRVLKYGDAWENALRQMRLEGRTFKQIASILGVQSLFAKEAYDRGIAAGSPVVPIGFLQK